MAAEISGTVRDEKGSGAGLETRAEMAWRSGVVAGRPGRVAGSRSRDCGERERILNARSRKASRSRLWQALGFCLKTGLLK